jgi:hypothetical protein
MPEDRPEMLFEPPDDDGQSIFNRRHHRASHPSGGVQWRERYPWLSTYLSWMRAGAVIVLVTGSGSSLFVLVKGIRLESSGATMNEGYALIVGGVVGFLVAFTEFVKVVMDIESNTRAVLGDESRGS